MEKSRAKSTATGIDRFLKDNSTCGRIMRDCWDYAKKYDIDLNDRDLSHLHRILQNTQIGLLERMGEYEVSLMVRSYRVGKSAGEA